MGMIVEGRWTEDDRTIEAGAFVRSASVYSQDLAPAVIEGLVSEPGRYHLIASLSCPWSHRALILHRLKGLADSVPLQIAGGRRVQGYAVNGGDPWPVPGTERSVVHLHQIYSLSDPRYSGRATVPLLWDARAGRILCNKSARIMRGFDAVGPAGKGLDFTFAPPPLRDDIDGLNSRIHRELSNAVYRAGLAQRQDAYDEAVAQVFAMLAELEARLSDRRYLFGATITETDWRLFPTLVRFDLVYFTHFRCTRRRLIDYPNLWAYARDLYAWRGIADTLDMTAIREGYYLNDGIHNPFKIVAAAPDADWRAPHGRAALGPTRVALRSGDAVAIDPATLEPGGG